MRIGAADKALKTVYPAKIRKNKYSVIYFSKSERLLRKIYNVMLFTNPFSKTGAYRISNFRITADVIGP